MKKFLTIVLFLTVMPASYANDVYKLSTIIEKVSENIGKPIIFWPSKDASLNITSEKKVVYDKAFLLQVLRLQQLAAIEKNGIIRVFPLAQAKAEIDTIASSLNDKFDPNEVVTYVHQVKHMNGKAVISVLRTLMPTAGHFAVYVPKNQLVLVDYWSNIQRLGKIIDKLDQPLTKEEQAKMQEREKRRAEQKAKKS